LLCKRIFGGLRRGEEYFYQRLQKMLKKPSFPL
jgi:hypothetical protein